MSFGLSLDDFALAFALSLLIPSETIKKQIINASKLAIAFSVSTALLPLLGWLVGLAIFEYVASVSAWVVLIVFCGVGVWIIKEAFEDESSEWFKKNIASFWILLVMGILGSLDEGAVGVGFPFLELPIFWIIVSVILTNIALIFSAMLISNWKKNLNKKIPSILSGFILIALGVMNFLELVFGI